ncbi:helix-turn-helix transcriptional regulator [Ramlibacter sp. AN1015]|uniref:helix-turn-helix domain-containing protein n=1 Tax=Ramlibacter sp. AN1015 TaxID=3133428 RepID=UPI0030C006CE
MPNIAAVLKSEIARIARKEIRSQTGALAETNSEQRKQIAALRQQILELQRAVTRLQKGVTVRPAPSKVLPMRQETSLRWRPEGFAQHRKRLGLSAEQMAHLVGCSALSVYKWESGKVRPRRAQLDAIARVRKLSKAAALQELEKA